MRKRRNSNSKLKKILTIVIILVIILLAFLYVFFNTDLLRTKRNTFHKYFETIPDALDVLEKYQDDNEKYLSQKENTPYTRKGTASIESSSNVADSNILDKIKFTINEKRDNSNEKNNIDFTVNNGVDTLETISYIENKDTFGVKCPDIVTGYVCVKNEQLTRVLDDIVFENISVSNEVNRINLAKLLETTKVEKNKILGLDDVVKTSLPATKYEKEKRRKVKIEDKTYNTTAYSISLNETESANLQINLLTKISQDSILMDYITSKCKLLNLGDEYTTINILNSTMKKRIDDLKKDPTKAKNLKITLCEYKQKNIRTEIQYGETKINITHFIDGENELSSIQIGDETYGLSKKDGKYILSYGNDEKELTLSAEWNQAGSIENNDIKNYVSINKKQGIKSITYKYEDSVQFTNDIGNIKDFTNESSAILNDFSDDEVKQFISLLKDKINQVYINKGASVGINLDPIFTSE